MLEENRIKEAESNIRKYLDEGLLRRDSNPAALLMYVKNAENSIDTAKKLLLLESGTYKPYLWIIVTSYYSMYYIANAVLLKLGYKVGEKISHKVTSDALIVFVRNKLKREMLKEYEEIQNEALELISSKINSIIGYYDSELEKRSIFQYRMDEELKKGKALTSLGRAQEFMLEMKKLLD